jgi:hypothetical protein
MSALHCVMGGERRCVSATRLAISVSSSVNICIWETVLTSIQRCRSSFSGAQAHPCSLRLMPISLLSQASQLLDAAIHAMHMLLRCTSGAQHSRCRVSFMSCSAAPAPSRGIVSSRFLNPLRHRIVRPLQRFFFSRIQLTATTCNVASIVL